MIETVVVGAIVGAAASYLAVRTIRAARKDGPACGGACGGEGGSAKENPRLGRRQELVQLGTQEHER